MNCYPSAPNSCPAFIKGLFESSAYSHPITQVHLIETHISWVLLTGQYAYKIKKPVNFGFLNFSSLEKRHFFCQEELRLNQRLAKECYLAVVPITGNSDSPKMAGTGEVIDFAVQMLQFPSSETLKDLCQDGQLSAVEIDQLAKIVADFHGNIEKVKSRSVYGDGQEVKRWFDENFYHIRQNLKNNAALTQLKSLEAWGQLEWSNKFKVLQERQLQGFVRECHGDLHLANITLINGTITLFDCIEFNPLLRWIDVISEVAFLVMDLYHLGYSNFAQGFLNRYLEFTGDYSGLAVLRYYLVYRAMVRAKVALLSTAQNQQYSMSDDNDEYKAYLNLAERFAHNNRKRLIITHGFSGAGKSTYASQLAEKIGAIQIRSDVERKRLLRSTSRPDSTSAMGEDIYTQEAGELTYHRLAYLSKEVLNAGYPVIVDATFLNSEHRLLFKQLAEKLEVVYMILDFVASEETLCQRINQRQNDASEATLAVLRHQMQTTQPLLENEKKHCITVKTEHKDSLAQLLGVF